MKNQKKKRKERILSILMASTMAVSTIASTGPMKVQAQQTGGNAPFVNTWLVSGPFETAVADSIYDTVVPENPNLAQKAVPTVSSETLAATNPAEYLIDGSERNQWVTEGTEVPCWAKLSWEDPITVGCMGITLWADNRHKNKYYDLIFTFADGKPEETVRLDVTVQDASAPTYYTPEKSWENVESVQILVDPGLDPYPSVTGIAEIFVYQYPLEEGASASVQALEIPGGGYIVAQTPEVEMESANLAEIAEVSANILEWDQPIQGEEEHPEEPEVYEGEEEHPEEPEVYEGEEEHPEELGQPDPLAAGSISPALGQSLEYEGESGAWEYFDDRIYNRNYDDYQDLNGYYGIKQNIDTKNKFVYAHTYVYSDKEQSAQVRVGASGSYRVYFNDEALIRPTVPKEVQKDMTIKDVTLKEGWNKLLIQIEHTYTEDLNSNGIPIAKDADVSYLGFYGRITDTSGDEIPGLIYSVEGQKSELAIVTQGLKSAEGLPGNTMPVGYKEWPYVWNKSTTNKAYGLSASAFRFQAAGGKPGYKWTLVDGELPDNLTLNEDGTIADGLENGQPNLDSTKGIIPATCQEGDYTFTVQVEDENGNTAQKEFTITVKERPNKWFEEGRVGALSHCIAIPRNFIDPNFSADLWAERAKAQGHSLVSIEALQQNYYWPSKFADPQHVRNLYMKKDENGQVVDGLKVFEEAVKRYGMKFGLYYATEGGGLQHYSTDVFVQNVADLIQRYNPAYLYFDGPQGMPGANYDVMYSNVRNYSNDIIINSNAWGEEFGDPDLGTHEASGIYANVGRNHFVKKVVFEPWKSAHTKNNPTPYYARRDDYAQVAKEMIMNAGRGYVDNNDQMPLMSRGTNWDSPEDVATRYPKSLQEFIDVRENVAAWFAPEGYSERHESTTGTTPYFLSGYGYADDGKGNYENFAFPDENTGPRWGYATSRDNNIYLHIMKGPDSKIGFEAIPDRKLTISPVNDKVTSVIWLNKDEKLTSFTQNGDSLTIDLSGVEEDKVDTIIKIVTDSKARRYNLTKLYLEGVPAENGKLQLNVEGQMTYPALKANLEKVTYHASTQAVSIDANGLVTPLKDGKAVVTVTGTCEGVSVSEEITVSVKNGAAFVDDEITSVVLHVEDREVYGELSCCDIYDVSVEGRSVKGGATGLNDAEIIWHTGTVDLKAGDNYEPIKITENNVLTVVDGKLIPKQVQEETRAVVWAEVKKGGAVYTSNRVYLDLRPGANLVKEAKITASVNKDKIENLRDGEVVNGALHDASKWSGTGTSWVAFELADKANISEVDIYFNTRDQQYVNTPDSIEIQESEDGREWNTAATVKGPTGSAWFGFYTPYHVDLNTKYVRLLFNGRDGGASDIMEVMLMGEDISNTLSRIEVEPQISMDGDSGTVALFGYDNTGKPVDLSGADIKLTSADESIVKVNADHTISPVNPGRTSIKVQVMQGRGYAEAIFYVTVDEHGKLQLIPYLCDVKLRFKSKQASYGSPFVAVPELTLSDGTVLDTTDVEMEYIVGDERLRHVEGTNTIVVKENVFDGFTTTIKAVAVYDGIAVESEEVAVTVTGRNLISNVKDITVSSVRDKNGVPDGNDEDERYLGAKAVDGDKGTAWAAKQADKSPWILLDFGAETEIGSVNLVDRGHAVNAIEEGLLEFFDGNGKLIYSQKVTEVKWEDQPDNIITLEKAVKAYAMKFTIDPEAKHHQAGSERGLAEIQIFAPERELEKSVVETIGANVVTEVGVIPTLPTEGIVVVYNTGEKETVSVTWNPITAEEVKEPGSFWVQGTINGTNLKVSARVRVVDKNFRPGDKTGLEALIKEAEKLDLANYTKESVDVLLAALEHARAVLADESLSTEDQAIIDAAVKALKDAMDGLKPVNGGDNNNGGNPDDGDDNNNAGDGGDNNNGGNNNNNGGNPDSGDGGTNGGNADDKQNAPKSPKTGDSAKVLLFWFLAVVSASIFCEIMKRKVNR